MITTMEVYGENSLSHIEVIQLDDKGNQTELGEICEWRGIWVFHDTFNMVRGELRDENQERLIGKVVEYYRKLGIE